MASVELKTKKNKADVDMFLDDITDENQREDCKLIRQMMYKASGDPGTMWGVSIVGFGSYHYKYASGREADWMKIGFSPRKGKTTLYIMNGFAEYKDYLSQIGKHTTGKGCLYIKSLKDVDQGVLQAIINDSYKSAAQVGAI